MLLLASYIQLFPTIVVQGNSTQAPYAFIKDVLCKTYDPRSGIFFVGLDATANPGSIYTISKAYRPTFNSTPQFTPLLINKTDDPTYASALLEKAIEFLAFSPQPKDPSILIAVAKNGTDFQASKTIYALYTEIISSSIGNSEGEDESDELHDANSAVTDGIVSIASNSTIAFAVVKPSGAPFGDAGTGVTMVGIGNSNSSPITLTTKDGTTGLNGNKAVGIDKSSPIIKGSGPDDVLFNQSIAPIYWDEPMQRLFVGFNITSGSDAGDYAKAIVVGSINSGILSFQTITPDSAIVAATNIGVATGADEQVSIQHLRVMHTSTGPDYLIVNQMTTSGGTIFALPLVNDINNPTSPLNGTYADYNSAINATTKKFTVPATNPGDLPNNNAVTNPEAIIGAGPLPIQYDDEVADICVVGDAVYVAIDLAFQATDNDSGIFYSQAMFDNDGMIIRWTPWAKRGVPLNALPSIMLPGGTTHNGAIKFLEVDGKMGNIWIVEGTTNKTVGITSWSTGITSTDLLSTLKKSLSSSCYCVLDLDQATRGFLNSTVQRYALFGGTNKVVFARTSQASNRNDASSPQEAITNYSLKENFLVTALPEKAGCCQVLEYSRTSTTAGDANNLNYFFAGTQEGLFVFANSHGNGFNVLNLPTLDMSPFSTNIWTKITTITGSVIDIKTSGAGGVLYVLTYQPTDTNPFSSTLYRIPFTSNINTMFDASNIFTIAQTNTDTFKNVIQFLGMQIMATDSPFSTNPESKEQLILATNQGLFRSDASQAGALQGVADAASQTAALWQTVAITMPSDKTTATTSFYGIAGMDTPVRNTVWPFSIQDQFGFKTFDRSSIYQYSLVTPTTAAYFMPEQFNARPISAPFTSLDPIIYFFSDGGRRFFIFNRITDKPEQTRIGIIPYDVTDWNVAQQGILSYPALQAVNQFYWIKQIGATGIIIAGTGAGVIGLQ
jgi:hypothetical protein